MRLAVTADDRSGAMEAAALCADAGLATTVVPWDLSRATPRERIGTESSARGGQECVVVDVRSRHLDPSRAAARIARAFRASVASGSDRHVHKIDSTLRGNWAAEIGELVRAGRQVLLIPAYPAAGRTCVDGVVLVHGVPVTDTEYGRDPSSPVRSSRPTDSLGDLAGRVTVADAQTDDEIDHLIASVGDDPGVVIAGPAAVIGAVARLVGPSARRSAPTVPDGDVLIVCGSRHPSSRSQAAAAAVLAGVTVIEPVPGLVADAEVVALELGVRAHEHLAVHPCRVVILLGGDTTDAFVADRPVSVLGSLGVGLALGRVDLEGRPQVIVTKPGGFGATNVLVDLLATRGRHP